MIISSSIFVIFLSSSNHSSTMRVQMDHKSRTSFLGPYVMNQMDTPTFCIPIPVFLLLAGHFWTVIMLCYLSALSIIQNYTIELVRKCYRSYPRCKCISPSREIMVDVICPDIGRCPIYYVTLRATHLNHKCKTMPEDVARQTEHRPPVRKSVIRHTADSSVAAKL